MLGVAWTSSSRSERDHVQDQDHKCLWLFWSQEHRRNNGFDVWQQVVAGLSQSVEPTDVAFYRYNRPILHIVCFENSVKLRHEPTSKAQTQSFESSGVS